MNIIQCGTRNLTAVPREIPVDATAVHLDGNTFPLLAPESFLGRSKLRTMFLNSSRIMGIVTILCTHAWISIKICLLRFKYYMICNDKTCVYVAFCEVLCAKHVYT